jgi:hypothetical protein
MWLSGNWRSGNDGTKTISLINRFWAEGSNLDAVTEVLEVLCKAFPQLIFVYSSFWETSEKKLQKKTSLTITVKAHY